MLGEATTNKEVLGYNGPQNIPGNPPDNWAALLMYSVEIETARCAWVAFHCIGECDGIDEAEEFCNPLAAKLLCA